ncbi:hypothetical protein E2562_030026, partial [Oryza meyeriana var. granulata]
MREGPSVPCVAQASGLHMAGATMPCVAQEWGPPSVPCVAQESGPRVARSATPRETEAHTADAGAPCWVGGSMSSIRKSSAEGAAH